ncbi:MAG: SGNH/GDSL hydrolase family protein [Pseudomonadota bacterium]
MSQVSDTETKKRTRPIVKVVIVLVYLVFLFLLVELLSYVAVVHLFDNALGGKAERHLYSSIRGHELNPDYQRQFDTGGQRIHSDQGFRYDSVVDLPKPNSTYRIFMMGGSTAYAIGSQGRVYPDYPTLTNSETVSYFLEQTLREQLKDDMPGVKIEVINAGVAAYHSFQHVLYIYETLYEYEPDLIVFLDGHNDFYNVGVKNPIQSYGYSSARMVDALNDREPFFAAYAFLRAPAEYSYTFKLASKFTQGLYQRYEAPNYNLTGDVTALERDFSAELAETARRGFLRNYKLIETFGAYHGFCYHVFLQPEVVFENVENLSAADQEIAQITRDWYVPGREQVMTRARAEFPALFDQADIPYTEIAEIAAPEHKDKSLYVDYTHLTAEGSKLVAARMLPVVIDTITKCETGS